MKTPIEMMLDGAQWKALDADQIACDHDNGLPYATHEGVLDIMGHKLRCYRLNTGQTVFHADDMNDFFAAGLGSNA